MSDHLKQGQHANYYQTAKRYCRNSVYTPRQQMSFIYTGGAEGGAIYTPSPKSHIYPHRQQMSFIYTRGAEGVPYIPLRYIPGVPRGVPTIYTPPPTIYTPPKTPYIPLPYIPLFACLYIPLAKPPYMKSDILRPGVPGNITYMRIYAWVWCVGLL